MGKKNKKKKYYQQAVNSASSAPLSASQPSPTSSASTVSAKPAPLEKSAAAYGAHAEEYRTVRHDLIRVALVNGVFLAAVLALYYANKSNPFLTSWYEKLF
ncbi:hypothetical protein IPM19_04660 [bacterium]|nr:MAG: hypothetical protein IPM19_04660 [bacterium]